jgi:hypothetical protein
MRSLDSIIDTLDRHHQRATYGAIAALLGTSQRSLMQRKTKHARNSWVVNKETHLPTDYAESEMHPALLSNLDVLESEEELIEWLDSVEGGKE